ncbi:MAG: type II toxin-antitoxin system HigB family toxin [Chloroflexota bacterium]|nr:type II toxin-antitoxin system HigB family toxin [Chloroflexota bacterium]MDE2841054.1 type II toxin-antitoxin system HigB family toxin [Chloroflexota bacterium]MDE2929407.1 type II toxin-antitoxin system HigB family toxin [Chloroflexota bacterium]
MRIIAKRTLREFWERHSNAEGPLRAWYDRVKKQDWDTPARVKEHFPDASILPNYRVVFRIKHNDYRLVVRVFYPGRAVYIRFVGTHAEYNRIHAEEV